MLIKFIDFAMRRKTMSAKQNKQMIRFSIHSPETIQFEIHADSGGETESESSILIYF